MRCESEFMAIHQADLKERRITYVVVAALAILGIAGGFWFYWWQGQLQVLAKAREDAEVLRQVALVSTLLYSLMSASLLGLSAIIWQKASKVVREQRYPTADSAIVRDAPVLLGEQAIQRGRLGLLAAGVCGVAALAVAGFGLYTR